ncbi:response regulator [Blautia argi]|uniref:response regulator n=1 Tax=Blautia argi TaxID=1912897 RepID=UPI0029428DC4|nr:response regulator [Blautia argi]
MYKLLIVDDEPLVQVGLKSMLNWNTLHIEICGIAGNGQEALDLIARLKPHIVIADIRMPVMSGLDLVRKCREQTGELPVFIMLTSYEEFEYAREALRYHVAEYLVKLELTPESLESAVKAAQIRVDTAIKKQDSSALFSKTEPTPAFDLQTLQDRFYIRLLNNLFENEEEFSRQSEELQICLNSPCYAAAHLELLSTDTSDTNAAQQLTLYNSTLQMFHKIMGKFFPCQIISLDLRYWAVIFSLDNTNDKETISFLRNAFRETAQMLHNYYNVTILAAVGRLLKQPENLSSSYRDAKQLSTQLTPKNPLLFFDELPKHQTLRNVFDMTLFREPLRKAFDEFDEDALHGVFLSIFDLFESSSPPYTQVMDAASNILHLTLTLLSDGADIATKIFSAEPDGYRSLYRQTSVNQIISYMEKLDSGFCHIFQEQKKDYKNHIVTNVKRYISAHIGEHLTLQNVADAFSISPNYLSQLFKKYNDTGFNEYCTQMKVEKAKQLLRNENQKVYEVSEALGFESAFYFSKVFKKATGMAPKDYQNHIL